MFNSHIYKLRNVQVSKLIKLYLIIQSILAIFQLLDILIIININHSEGHFEFLIPKESGLGNIPIQVIIFKNEVPHNDFIKNKSTCIKWIHFAIIIINRHPNLIKEKVTDTVDTN